MKKSNLKFPIVINDILLALVILFSLVFFTFDLSFRYFNITDIAIKATLMSLVFLGFIASFSAYLFIEYRYNHLTFKNIFFYIGGAIILLNLIAIACLPNMQTLPHGGILEILPLDRIYYLLSGITLSAIPVTFFYLLPRRINNRKYIDITLIIIILITALCIVVSFFTDYQNYIKIFSFEDIDVGLASMFGAKNVFAKVLLTGVVATTFLHFRTKNWKWLLILIPFGFILLLSAGKMAIFLGALYLLNYLIIHLVLLAKKSRDNLVIISLISGFVILFGAYVATMMAISTDGILFSIKKVILNAFDNLKITFASRELIWTCSFALLAPYQYIFGVGLNAFGLALHITYTPITTWDKNIYAAHNAGIEIIGRGGVLLLLIYLFLYAYLFYLSAKIYKKKLDIEDAARACGNPKGANMVLLGMAGTIVGVVGWRSPQHCLVPGGFPSAGL